MGLAAPKRRTRISHDPNNTRWTRDDTGFGRRILQKQGWTPGSYLGASDAAHAAHYTAANASHVRVALREDNLGLGASKGANAERFGLDMFSGLLGRLNGKTVEKPSEKHETAKRDVQLRLWQEGRYGGVRFVSAGFLVGDEVKALRREQLLASGGKRKADCEDQASERAETTKTEKRRKVVASPPSEMVNPSTSNKTVAGKRKSKSEPRKDRGEDETLTPAADSTSEAEAARKARKAERAERRRQKEERRLRKQRKLAKLDNIPSSAASSQPPETTEGEEAGGSALVAVKEVPTTTRHTVTGRRGAVRQRWVQQKRLATLDQKALNEIFMIKTSA